MPLFVTSRVTLHALISFSINAFYTPTNNTALQCSRIPGCMLRAQEMVAFLRGAESSLRAEGR